MLRAVTEQGYTAPTTIQSEAIPTILSGQDLLARAQTGTGKTAAFTLPMLQRLIVSADGGSRRVRALVLTPTRELAEQTATSIRRYGQYSPLRHAELYGGLSVSSQARILRRGVDTVVATPGRLEDHVVRRNIDLSNVEVLVLDEADRMLDLGFMPAVERIVELLPARRQTLMFSATLSGPVRTLAKRFMREPAMVDVAALDSAPALIEQVAFLVDSARKRALLMHLIESQAWHQVLVFTSTRRGADALASGLVGRGFSAVAIHGEKSQVERMQALEAFKRNAVRVLVATDVAARGIDIHELPHVVNYDLPNNPEDYVHRIGRTGRGGRTGMATSLVCGEERSKFMAIKRLLNADIPTSVRDGFEPGRRVEARRRPRGGGLAGRLVTQAQLLDGSGRPTRLRPRGDRARAPVGLEGVVAKK